MVDVAKRAGIPWDAILGAEVTQAYKPAPQAYIRLAEVLGLAPAEVCMVAAHNNDLNGAQGCGLTTAFVARPTEPGPGQTINLAPPGDRHLSAPEFPTLADQAAGAARKQGREAG